MTEELWRPVVGYEGKYEVSDRGNVRSLDRMISYRNGRDQRLQGRTLLPALNVHGRRIVNLAGDGKKQTRLIYQLVMAAFVGPRPPGMDICHNDGQRTNDALTNLRYDTPSNNALDRVRHGTDRHAARTHCPRRHPLLAPNLVQSETRRGGRSCLACYRAHNNVNHAKRNNKPHDFEAWADNHFARIMNAHHSSAM